MDFELTEPKTEAEFEAYYRLRYERLRQPLGLAPGAERVGNVGLFKRHGYVEQGDGVTLYGQVESVAMVRPLQ